MKIEIQKKGEVRLKSKAQWVATTSRRLLDAELRQRLQDGCQHVAGNNGALMAANNIEIFVRHRQFTVRYFYKRSLSQVVLVHIWIDGQDHD